MITLHIGYIVLRYRYTGSHENISYVYLSCFSRSARLVRAAIGFCTALAGERFNSSKIPEGMKVSMTTS